jgi:hypothetical protein
MSGRTDRPGQLKETEMNSDIMRQVAKDRVKDMRAAAKADRRARKVRSR